MATKRKSEAKETEQETVPKKKKEEEGEGKGEVKKKTIINNVFMGPTTSVIRARDNRPASEDKSFRVIPLVHSFPFEEFWDMVEKQTEAMKKSWDRRQCLELINATVRRDFKTFPSTDFQRHYGFLIPASFKDTANAAKKLLLHGGGEEELLAAVPDDTLRLHGHRISAASLLTYADELKHPLLHELMVRFPCLGVGRHQSTFDFGNGYVIKWFRTDEAPTDTFDVPTQHPDLASAWLPCFWIEPATIYPNEHLRLQAKVRPVPSEELTKKQLHAALPHIKDEAHFKRLWGSGWMDDTSIANMQWGYDLVTGDLRLYDLN